MYCQTITWYLFTMYSLFNKMSLPRTFCEIVCSIQHLLITNASGLQVQQLPQNIWEFSAITCRFSFRLRLNLKKCGIIRSIDFSLFTPVIWTYFSGNQIEPTGVGGDSGVTTIGNITDPLFDWYFWLVFPPHRLASNKHREHFFSFIRCNILSCTIFHHPQMCISVYPLGSIINSGSGGGARGPWPPWPCENR